MSGRHSRNKGRRLEQELVRYLKQRGLGARRVPLSGSCEGYPGDVIVDRLPRAYWEEITLEVKGRKQGFRELYKWLEDCGGVALKADGRDWLIVTRLEEFLP